MERRHGVSEWAATGPHSPPGTQFKGCHGCCIDRPVHLAQALHKNALSSFSWRASSSLTSLARPRFARHSLCSIAHCFPHPTRPFLALHHSFDSQPASTASRAYEDYTSLDQSAWPTHWTLSYSFHEPPLERNLIATATAQRAWPDDSRPYTRRSQTPVRDSGSHSLNYNSSSTHPAGRQAFEPVLSPSVDVSHRAL
jgi:hypothetical protein